MDQNRLFIAIALSVAILLGFQFLLPHRPTPQHRRTPRPRHSAETAAACDTIRAFPGTQPARSPPPQDQRTCRACRSTRRKSAAASTWPAPASMTSCCATTTRRSPREPARPPARAARRPAAVLRPVRLDRRRGVKVPDRTRSGPRPAHELTDTHPVTLTWDNGAGQVFQLSSAVDDNYMFTVQQTRPATTAPRRSPSSLVAHPPRLHAGHRRLLHPA